jgi:hypothetical protein
MAFSLSFSPEFFFAEGEPYDCDPQPSDRPVSVWQAIISIPEERYAEMASEIFGLDDHPEFLGPETVMEKIQETDTCTDLRSPVEVWIDPDGYYTVFVYDKKETE